MKRDLYTVDVDAILNFDGSPLEELGIVEYSAIELDNNLMFSSNKPVYKFKFDDTKYMIAGYMTLSDKPIYRIDEDDYEYDLVFTKEATQALHEKLMSDKEKGSTININFQHKDDTELKRFKNKLNQLQEDGETGDIKNAFIYDIFYVDTDEKRNFIKEQYGISLPEKFKNSEGSFAVVKVANKEYYNFLKETGIKNFSIETYLEKVLQSSDKFKNKNKNKKVNMKKKYFAKTKGKFSKKFSFVTESEEINALIGSDAELIDKSLDDYTGEVEVVDVDGNGYTIDIVDGEIVDITEATETTEMNDEEKGKEEMNEADVKDEVKKEEELSSEEKEDMEEEDESFNTGITIEEVDEKINALKEEMLKMVADIEAKFEKSTEDNSKNEEKMSDEKEDEKFAKDKRLDAIKTYILK